MWDHHELGECRSSQESIVGHLKIEDLKLYILCAEIFLCPEGYGKSDLTDGDRWCARDYAMEGGPTRAHQGPR
jgi:hypothetical protein